MKKPKQETTRRQAGRLVTEPHEQPVQTPAAYAGNVWDQVKRVLERRLSRFSFHTTFRGTSLLQDDGQHIVVEVEGAMKVSHLASHHAADIFDALATIGRASATVRLQTNLALYEEVPDWYIRDLVPPRQPGVERSHQTSRSQSS